MPHPEHPTFEVNLALVGVRYDDWNSVVVSVARLKEVESASMQEMVLVCKLNVGNISKRKRDVAVKKICDKIVEIAEHKAANPGRGVYRRKERKLSYTNDPRRS